MHVGHLTRSLTHTQAAFETHFLVCAGVLIITASAGGIFPMPTAPVYAAAKAGLVNFTRSLAPRLAKRGIRVCALCPQAVDTAMVHPMPHPHKTDEVILLRQIWEGNLVRPPSLQWCCGFSLQEEGSGLLHHMRCMPCHIQKSAAFAAGVRSSEGNGWQPQQGDGAGSRLRCFHGQLGGEATGPSSGVPMYLCSNSIQRTCWDFMRHLGLQMAASSPRSQMPWGPSVFTSNCTYWSKLPRGLCIANSDGCCVVS